MMNYYLSNNTVKKTDTSISIHHRGNSYALGIEHFSQTMSRGNPKPHSHPVYHLLYYVTAGEIRIGDTIYSAEQGQLIFISPDVPHCFFSESSQPYSYFEITFAFTDSEGTPLTLPFEDMLLKLHLTNMQY